MDASLIRETGIGGVVLSTYLYLYIELMNVDLDHKTQFTLAVTPVLLIILLIDSLNDLIMKKIVGEKFLKKIHSEIRDEIGNDRFYYGHEGKQEKIDEYDQKSVQKVVSIAGGIIVCGTLPAPAYIEYGTVGLIGSIVADIIIAYIFIYRQYINLRKIIKSSVRLYN